MLSVVSGTLTLFLCKLKEERVDKIELQQVNYITEDFDSERGQTRSSIFLKQQQPFLPGSL